jgi:phosphatidate cytidylyltransferase
MAGINPANGRRWPFAALAGHSNLALRVMSSLVLAPAAVAAAYFGGVTHLAFWLLAAIGVLWEWNALVCAHDKVPVLAVGAVALAGAGLLLAFGWTGTALALISLGLLGVATLASKIRRYWCAGGVVYAGALLVAPVMLRHDVGLGFAGMLFVFAVVWLTDIAAYFAGRAIGGPKLMPSISPNKTWSGAVGGTAAGVIGGVAIAQAVGGRNLAAIALVAVVLSVIAQAGDFLESAIKRRFYAKDASTIIPGHGGLMDRLDGFVTAVTAALLIGLMHDGLEAPARGLIIW